MKIRNEAPALDGKLLAQRRAGAAAVRKDGKEKEAEADRVAPGVARSERANRVRQQLEEDGRSIRTLEDAEKVMKSVASQLAEGFSALAPTGDMREAVTALLA